MMGGMAMNEQKTLNVTISGRDYVLATDEPQDVFATAVHKVDESMNEILSSGLHQDRANAAVLTALRFALEVVKNQNSDTSRDEKLKELIGMLS
ncbi:cell division protein ZapA [Candidatus Babeliales bacterium]|nr:cell division protein ZapA [Candidatus Babeliales bacterium]